MFYFVYLKCVIDTGSVLSIIPMNGPRRIVFTTLKKAEWLI